MGSAFHQLCPRYSGTLTPTAPTAIRLWKTFTFTLFMPSKETNRAYFERAMPSKETNRPQFERAMLSQEANRQS